MNPLHAKSLPAGHLAALLTIMIWGTTFISTKILLNDFSPYEILLTRFAIGYIALLVFHPRLLRSSGLRQELLFAGAGLCGVTLYFLVENVALTYTMASNVGIIVSVAPFFTAVLAHFFLQGENLQPRFFAGFAIAMAGIVVISRNGGEALQLHAAGDGLAVLACLFWAAYSVLMRKISRLGLNTIACTRRVFLYGLLFMGLLLPFQDMALSPERLLVPVNLLNLLFLGLGASAMCFVSWNWCVGVLGAIQTSVYIYLVPVVTVLASFLILGEQLSGLSIVGAVMTLAGLVFSESRGKKRGKRISEHIRLFSTKA